MTSQVMVQPRSVVVSLGRLVFATSIATVGTAGSMLALLWMVDPPPEATPRETSTAFEIVAPPADVTPPEPMIESVVPSVAPAATAPAPTRAMAAAPSAIAGIAPGSIGSALSGMPALGSGMPIAIGTPTAGDSGLPTLAEVEPDIAARPVSRPAPRYPPSAQRAGIEGSVVVRLRIDERGAVVDVVVVDATPKGVFDDVAVAAAKAYRFAAARRGGKAVATTVEQRVVFRLGR